MNAKINFQTRAIAKTFLIVAAERGISLSGFKLIKLMYVAHRVMLDHFSRPLISSESFSLWKFGPTLESLHGEFKKFEGQAVDVNSAEIRIWPDVCSDLCSVSVIQVVLETFGSMPTMVLSEQAQKSDILWRHKLKEYSPMKLIDINPSPNFQCSFEGVIA
ncbi:MAG: DUF4065 domain-containing protein [bacterium]|nr:DUF4065 domain-containing protein [bacterium]